MIDNVLFTFGAVRQTEKKAPFYLVEWVEKFHGFHALFGMRWLVCVYMITIFACIIQWNRDCGEKKGKIKIFISYWRLNTNITRNKIVNKDKKKDKLSRYFLEEPSKKIHRSKGGEREKRYGKCGMSQHHAVSSNAFFSRILIKSSGPILIT